MADNYGTRWRRKSRELGLEVSALTPCDLWLLPVEAPPQLRFDKAANPMPLWEAHESSLAWTPFERERLASYRVIGADGGGNPICLSSRTIMLLDLDSGFHKSVYMNRGIPELAECLLAYLGETVPDRFRAAVLEIEPDALAAGTFWDSEANLIGEGW